MSYSLPTYVFQNPQSVVEDVLTYTPRVIVQRLFRYSRPGSAQMVQPHLQLDKLAQISTIATE
jgi:hypothetical protein